MSVSSGFNAVLYAKDLSVMTAFYRRILDVTAVEERPSIVALRLGGSRLMPPAIPAHIADTFTIDVPPVLALTRKRRNLNGGRGPGLSARSNGS